MTDTSYQVGGIWFPYDAASLFKEWSAQRNVYIHVMTIEVGKMSKVPQCDNCKDLGGVYLRLSRGNFNFIPLGKTVTFFEGAWHVIEETRGFICPVCAGKGASAVRPQTSREEAQEMIDNLPGAGDLVDDWTNH